MTDGTAGTAPSIALITVSYRGDLELAVDLCRSVDEYLHPAAEHVLVVPRADVPMFAPLLSPRRRLVRVEDVLPTDYLQLPVPREVRIGRYHRRIRELWLTPAGVVRGWIVQQIVKLSASGYTDADTIVFADSDVELIARLDPDRLVGDGRTRLYRVPGATADRPSHIAWHSTASRLLGLAPVGYTGCDYIGNLITWRRRILLDLLAHVESVTGRRWDRAIGRERAFSEYILYGVYADLVLGTGTALLEPTTEDLALAGWFYDMSTPEGRDRFIAGLAPEHVAVAIQSTEPLTREQRREIVDRVRSARPG